MNRKTIFIILLILIAFSAAAYFAFIKESIPFTSKERCEQATKKECYFFQDLCQAGKDQNQKETETNEKILKDCLLKIGTWQPTQTTSQSPRAQSTTETIQSSSSDSRSLDERIAACYSKNENCSACQPITNNSIQYVSETSRRFINIPKDLYPREIGPYFITVNGNATAGWISNGGLPGEGLDAIPECWSTYYEFNGNGEVNLRIKSTKTSVPDYFVRFIVGSTQ